jgi:cysteinyl-tRNA synthetase
MALHLRSTLTRTKEPFASLVPGAVRMYTCGPTVYRYAHIGNLRSYLLADLLRRALLARGFNVLHVKNITDVGHLRDERFDRGEDKMLVAAKLEAKSPEEIARFYEATFHADEALVNILPAHVFPRATDHIDEMVAMVERLEDAGFAYAVEGNVYYEVARFPGYGALSGNTLDELRAGHRGEIEADKRDPADFALWKRAGEGRLAKWPTRRWGEGFPGWHIECSAMATKYLGQQFDIHTGGIDNVFPHHEDEIAQSKALTGVLPARYWVHGEHLLVAGRRMAKSAGNFQRITELAEQGIEPLAFRLLCLTSHYRAKMNISGESLRGAQAGLASLRARARAIGREAATSAAPGGGVAAGEPGPDGVVPPGIGTANPAALSASARALFERWTAAVNDDLNLPKGLAIVREAAKASDLPAAERRWLLLEADRVLGLDLARELDAGAAAAASDAAAAGEAGEQPPGTPPDAPLPAGAAALLAERAAARAAKDWGRSDALRAELAAIGVVVTDRPGGLQSTRIGDDVT